MVGLHSIGGLTLTECFGLLYGFIKNGFIKNGFGRA